MLDWQLPQRILVAYILYSMYAPYPITVNPFKSVLLVAFVRERNSAIRAANEGSVSNSEQLVWVLWKILRGDGNDVRITGSLSYLGLIVHLVDWSLYSKHVGEITLASQAES